MEIWLVSVVTATALTSGYFVWTWFDDGPRSTHRLLRRTRVSTIASLVDGRLACIVGTVEPEGPPLKSMVAQRSCVAYDTTVTFLKPMYLAVPSHVEVERRLVPFYVSDGTGRVRVDATEAALCNRPIVKSERYVERVIEAGAKIRIVGSVVREPVLDPHEHGYREGGTTATLTGTSKWPVLIDLER